MRRIFLVTSILALNMIFCQCKSNTSKTIVADVKDHNEIVINNSIIKMEELKGMGIDKNILLKHIKLQELAWYGGDFRDDQSKPRYEPTKEDFLLTIPFVDIGNLQRTFFKKDLSMYLTSNLSKRIKKLTNLLLVVKIMILPMPIMQ